ncbi:hypothetical protein [Pradoshia sp.]
MILKNMANLYNLTLSLGAFYLGISMFLGKGGFDTFPPEWIGTLPFTNWASLGLFGILVFGLGNAFASIYGFIKKGKIFMMTITMGALFFLCTVIPTYLVGEWYLPTGIILILSLIRLFLGMLDLIVHALINHKWKMS